VRNPKSGTCWARKIQVKQTLFTTSAEGKETSREARKIKIALGVTRPVAKTLKAKATIKEESALQ